ncbi:hypothetical protein BDV95DRAFT_601645 [Massariosphaeria phaeospora]|uniref:AA1-like domain-containing protein n=1 Tax=Massariosphaeria phaeospora TaxID=100035 RepID=A0A7C8ILH1_9PLEO|nr:hypothetical protein BDV95DRAFT_601645 [Massariosphaeria phaeospora]
MHPTLLLAALFAITTWGLPVVPPTAESVTAASPTLTFHVSDFIALDNTASPHPLSYLSFLFSDRHPDHSLSTTCTLAPSSDKIYKPLFSTCANAAVSFRVSEGEVEIRRGWKSGSGGYMTGTARQGTYWKEGEGGNATKTDGGKFYSRTVEWELPVTSLSAKA